MCTKSHSSTSCRSRWRPPSSTVPWSLHEGFQLGRPLAGNQVWNIQLRRQRRWSENSFGKGLGGERRSQVVSDSQQVMRQGSEETRPRLGKQAVQRLAEPVCKKAHNKHMGGAGGSPHGGDLISTSFPHSSHQGFLTHCLSRGAFGASHCALALPTLLGV